MAQALNSQPLKVADGVGGSPKPCEYLKSRGANIIHKLLAMARCNVHSRKLVSAMRLELAKVLPPRPKTPSHDLLSCSTCEGYMTRPVNLPCGHSHCHLCLEKPSDKDRELIMCSKCQESHARIPVGFDGPRRPTLLLQSICSKYYPPEMITCYVERERGNEFAQVGNYSAAIEYYNEALRTGCLDHRVYGNRSLAYLAMSNPQESLNDAEHCCILRPNWPKGHYRRGRALAAMGQYHESTAAYLLSLHLGGGELQCLCQALDNLVASQAYSSLDTQQLMVSIVTIALETMSKYQKNGSESSLSTNSRLPFETSQIDPTDFECVLCTCLLFCPVTVPCGHTFCRECLSRLFDHSPFCPVCRSSLGETFAQHTQSSGQMCVDKSLDQLIQYLFPSQYEEKRISYEQEKLRLARTGISESEELPIFICTMGFPGMPCPLHIFEARYRLMMRRCIDNNSRRFGICAPTDDAGSSFVDYGTVLFISSLEYTPDGRSLITTVGERRFQVLERNTRDGYAVARIRFISDDPPIEDLRALELEVYQHCIKWLNSLPFFTRLMVMEGVSSPPPEMTTPPPTSHNGPAWVWWFVNAIPTSHHNKLQFLQSTSLKQRLLLLKEALPLPALPA